MVLVCSLQPRPSRAVRRALRREHVERSSSVGWKATRAGLQLRDLVGAGGAPPEAPRAARAVPMQPARSLRLTRATIPARRATP